MVDLTAPTETDRSFLAAVANILGGAARQRATEAALLHQARHDPLTGLPNRLELADRLTHALARRSREPVSLLLLDLDGFKAINDQLGHDAGDRLLQQVATRPGDCLRPEDTLVRLGGDEFTVIVNDLDQDGAIDLVNRLTAALADPFALPGHATVGATSAWHAPSPTTTPTACCDVPTPPCTGPRPPPPRAPLAPPWPTEDARMDPSSPRVGLQALRERGDRLVDPLARRGREGEHVEEAVDHARPGQVVDLDARI